MKALNVDDKDDNLYFLETVLRSVGFEVVNAHNGIEGLALLQQGDFDLIVSDVLMPQMDGFQFCREVRRRPEFSGIAFVFYTGSYTDKKDIELAQQLGASRYLIKPMDPGLLSESLLEVVREGREKNLVAPPNPEEESAYLRNYSARLVHKLEQKVAEYEALSHRLQSAFDEKVMEVAERRHVEDSLRLSEERYRAVVGSLAEGILLADQGGQIVACNDSAARILGFSRTQLLLSSISNPPWHALSEAGVPLMPAAQPLNLCLSEGISRDGVVWGIRRSAGVLRWLSAAVRPCQRNLRGAVVLAAMSFTDITEERSAQEKIREQANIIDHSNDAIVICESDGTIRHWNKGAERLYGWSQAEAVGTNERDLFSRVGLPFESPVRRVLAESIVEGEYHHCTKDGREIVVHGRYTSVRSSEGQPLSVLAIFFDITEKKVLEEKFLRAQRLESIGILAGGVAHDLNNILAPILLAIPIVRNRVQDSQSLMLLDTMEASATRGAQIVRQILTFSRGLRTEKTSIQVRHLLKEIAEIIQETFPRNITIETDLPRALWLVEADTTQLHQVFMNLCVNARDAMPNGGMLTFQGENLELDEKNGPAHPQVKHGRFVRISIIDTGFGISETIRKRLFEPFFTTKEPGKGTGLGLSTARSIVEQHQGFMSVHSVPGEGSRFEVYLPALETEEEAAPVLSRDLPKGNGELILVVDDEFALRHICESLLTVHDYRVITADSGQQALALLRSSLMEVAMVITDLLMPNMSGPELIPMLRGLKPSLKIVAISGTVSTESENRPPAGVIVDAFLNKPFPAEKLLLTVHEVLAERRPY